MLNNVRNRRGLALPASLMGLVIVSFLVAAAISSSGTEIMSSSAHQRSTTALYGADGALERYVAEKSALAAARTDSLHPITGDTRIAGFSVDVARLYTKLDSIPGDTLRQNQMYSLLVRPASGTGRSVAALVTTARKAKMFAVSMPAALTSGGDVEVSGGASVSDGSATGCTPAPNALQATSGSTVTVSGASTVQGKSDTTSFNKSELVNRYLGGRTLTQLADSATVKFAAGELVTSGPKGEKVSSTDNTGVPRNQTNKYNWGCPSGHACSLVLGNESNGTYRPTVAIDAGGKTISISNDHGQGILIVYNGSLEIAGQFTWHGVILVEKDVFISGTTSGTGVKISGAVMALGANSTTKDNVSGNATITYNKCLVDTMTNPINIPRVLAAPQTFPARTHSWFELIG